MKKIIIPFLFLSIPPFFLFAQKEITTKWYHETFDTLQTDTSRWKSCIPYDIIDLNNGEVVLGTFDFRGWTMRSIEKNTGKVNWLNARTPAYPDSTKQKFYFDNMYLRNNGDIDVYGVKSFNTSEHAAYGDGNPIKIRYNTKTGAEKNVYFPIQANGKNDNITKLGSLSGYIPADDNKSFYYLDRRLYDPRITFMLYKLDSNLIIRDTITKIYDGKDPNNPKVEIHDISRPHKVNKNIYFISSIWEWKFDTSTLQKIFYKINPLNGNILIKKKIGTSIYNRIYYNQIKNISDSYLISGFVDTTNNMFLNPATASNTTMTAKIDTNGNVVWKAFLVRQGIELMDIVAACEDKSRNGYWALAGNVKKGGLSYLYFINQKGKPSFVSSIKFADNQENTFPNDLWLLNDGSLFVAYGYSFAQTNFIKARAAWGVSLIESADLDKALITSVPDILPDFLVKVFPNPARDLLNINILEMEDKLKVECYDLQGRLIYQSNFQNSTQINTAAWQRGLYAVVIRDELGRLVKSEKVILE